MDDMDVVERVEYEGYTIRIYYDPDPPNPRTEYDNLGTLIAKTKRENYSDKGVRVDLGDYSSWSEAEAAVMREYGPSILLPVYMYEHSGIALSTSPYHDPWDSGRLGLIFVPLATVRDEYGVRRISKNLRERVVHYLKGEIETYSAYLNGEVYGVTLMLGDEELFSCWGYFDKEYAIEDAKRDADADIASRLATSARLQEAAEAGAE
jgi:hypothetical protein